MVAAAGRMHPLGSLGFGAGVGSGTKVTTTTLKRKTPSELRVKLYTPPKNRKKFFAFISLIQHIAISLFFPLI